MTLDTKDEQIYNCRFIFLVTIIYDSFIEIHPYTNPCNVKDREWETKKKNYLLRTKECFDLPLFSVLMHYKCFVFSSYSIKDLSTFQSKSSNNAASISWNFDLYSAFEDSGSVFCWLTGKKNCICFSYISTSLSKNNVNITLSTWKLIWKINILHTISSNIMNNDVLFICTLIHYLIKIRF